MPMIWPSSPIQSALQCGRPHEGAEGGAQDRRACRLAGAASMRSAPRRGRRPTGKAETAVLPGLLQCGRPHEGAEGAALRTNAVVPDTRFNAVGPTKGPKDLPCPRAGPGRRSFNAVGPTKGPKVPLRTSALAAGLSLASMRSAPRRGRRRRMVRRHPDHTSFNAVGPTKGPKGCRPPVGRRRCRHSFNAVGPTKGPKVLLHEVHDELILASMRSAPRRGRRGRVTQDRGQAARASMRSAPRRGRRHLAVAGPFLHIARFNAVGPTKGPKDREHGRHLVRTASFNAVGPTKGTKGVEGSASVWMFCLASMRSAPRRGRRRRGGRDVTRVRRLQCGRPHEGAEGVC